MRATLPVVQDVDVAGLRELFGFDPVGPFLLHLAEGVTAGLERFQRLLQGLRDITRIDHAAPQVNDLVDIFNQQWAFRLTGAAGGAGPDFVRRINSADQWLAIVRTAQNRVVPKAVISRFGREKSGRQGPAHRIGRALRRAPSAIGAGIEVEHVLPGEILKGLHSERLHLIQVFIGNTPSHRLQSPAVQPGEVDTE